MGDDWQSAGHGVIGDRPAGWSTTTVRCTYGYLLGSSASRFRIKERWPHQHPFCDSPHPALCAALRDIKLALRPPTNFIPPYTNPHTPRLYTQPPYHCPVFLTSSTDIEPNSQTCANALRKEHGGPSVGISSATWSSPLWTATRTSASAATCTPKAVGTPDASRTLGPTSQRTSTPSRTTASSVARPPRAKSPHDHAPTAPISA